MFKFFYYSNKQKLFIPFSLVDFLQNGHRKSASITDKELLAWASSNHKCEVFTELQPLT